MKVLVTGAGGFVGPHAIAALRRRYGSGVDVVATSREAGRLAGEGTLLPLDVTDSSAVRAALVAHRPTHILHLAGVAAPLAASSNRAAAWRIHVSSTLDLAMAMMDILPDSLLVHVGSGLVYGDSFREVKPLDETAPLAPVGDYAVTKAAADFALDALSRQGLRCVRMRPFNHIGPGQSEDFAVSSFAAQIARIEAGILPPVLRVGVLTAKRDFLDVRAVADAYALVLEAPREKVDGKAFNVCSGVPRRMDELVELLLAASQAKIEVEFDRSKVTADNIAISVGDASQIKAAVGWQPQQRIEDTLDTVLNYWRERCRGRA